MEHCQVSEDANRDTLFHDLLERGIRDEMMMNECKYSFVFLQLLLVQLFLFCVIAFLSGAYQLFFEIPLVYK